MPVQRGSRRHPASTVPVGWSGTSPLPPPGTAIPRAGYSGTLMHSKARWGGDAPVLYSQGQIEQLDSGTGRGDIARAQQVTAPP